MSFIVNIDGKEAQVSGDEDVVISSAIHDISNLSSRNGKYSNVFKLPDTNTVREIYESAHLVNSVTKKPYRMLPAYGEARVRNSIRLIDGFAQLISSENGFETRLVGGNADIFGLMGEKYISDIDLSAWNHLYTQAVVGANRLNTYVNNFVYPNVDYGMWTHRNNLNITFQELYPAVYLKPLMEKMFAGIGYTIAGDILTDVKYQKTALPFSNKKFAHPESWILHKMFKASSTGTQLITADNMTVHFQDDSTGVNYDNGNNYSTITDEYVVSDAFTGTFGCNLTASLLGPAFGNQQNFKICKNGVPMATTIINASGAWNVAYTGSFATGDIITVQADGGAPAPDWNLSGAVFYVDAISDVIDAGSTVDVAYNLPKIKQKDLLRWVANRFNLVFKTDNINKVVTFVPFDDIKKNKNKAYVWDNDKLDLSQGEPKIEYIFKDYGQTNYYRWKEDSADKYLVLDPDYGMGSFTVDNEFLEPEQDIYTAPFAATKRITSFDAAGTPHECAYIPIFDDVTFTSSYSPQARIGIIDITADVSGLSFHSVTDTQSAKVMFSDMTWDIVLADHYEVVLDILNDTRIVEPLIRLTNVEFKELDHTIPVWMPYYKNYFYINEVKQFNATKLDSCFVQLVRI